MSKNPKFKRIHHGGYSSVVRDRKGNGHPSVNINPLENPECFVVINYCKKCETKVRVPAEEDDDKPYLCNKCKKEYLKKQESLKKKGFLTDEEVKLFAKRRFDDWTYRMGFIDGYIQMRDGEPNILSEIKVTNHFGWLY